MDIEVKKQNDRSNYGYREINKRNYLWKLGVRDSRIYKEVVGGSQGYIYQEAKKKL